MIVPGTLPALKSCIFRAISSFGLPASETTSPSGDAVGAVAVGAAGGETPAGVGGVPWPATGATGSRIVRQATMRGTDRTLLS